MLTAGPIMSDRRHRKREKAVARRLRGASLPVSEAVMGTHACDPPAFQKCGRYEDVSFVCKDCGKKETWTAAQQKWWYEVAHGGLNTTAVRCRPCRRRERERKRDARRIQLEGMARKRAQQ